MGLDNIFFKEQNDLIVDAIAAAELNTSAEVRVRIENRCKGEVMSRAIAVFEILEMNKTELHNGVLIYISIKDRKIAILGDKGINDVVEEGFWDSIYEYMAEEFRESRFAEGIAGACKFIGEKLKEHFPYSADDINELPNEISFG